jgi:sensor domain DACNG-containing protein/sensor domain DACNH-containing protein
MWGFQRTFRSAVEIALRRSLEMLGAAVEPTVFLIGLLKEGGSGHPLCVEPEDGPIVPTDFDRLDDRATELFDQDPESKVLISAAWIREKRQQQTIDRAYGTAIGEVLETRLGPGLRFFVALPVPVDQHMVFTAVGLPELVFDDTPHLSSTVAADRYPVTQSLVRGAVDEILRLSRRALYEPYPGADIDIGADPADVAKAAGKALIRSATTLAGNEMSSDLFDGLNRVATTRYERRVGSGSLLLADPGSEHIDRSVTLREPVPVGETRTFRKLLETSNRQGESLLTDGSQAYGLGRQRADYPEASESVFQLLVVSDGVWELHHADVPLATVQFGTPRLPGQPLQRQRLDDIASRVFSQCDSDALWALATAAADAEHGTMLVVSESAAAEAARLENQALTVEPTRLDDSLVRQVTGIDGAVLVDPSGYCHAIGVILDGTTVSEGDRSRGARYNSAVKYLSSAGDTPTVILLVSEDGMINLLPDLRPRMHRADLDAMLVDLREAAAIDPVHPERFYKAYRRIEAAKFYLLLTA